MQIDGRVMELLASRICHDLVSPVSAINNGVELIEDIGESVTEEAMKLIGNSATLAARRLKLFRIAYGRAGSEEILPLRDVRTIVLQYMEGGKITLSWPEMAPDYPFVERRGALKGLVNTLMMVEELLPYGGSIALSSTLAPDGESACLLSVTGRAARVNEAAQAAVEGETPVEDLNARTIQAYITGRFVEAAALRLSFRQKGIEELDVLLAPARREYDENLSV